MQLHRAALVIVVLATLGACVPSSATVLKDLVVKLDKFATGEQSASGVTKDELIAVCDAWRALPKEVKAKGLEFPQYKLLYHFGILPTERVRDQPDDVFAAHIRRFEQAYKRFRPAYLGDTIDNYATGSMKMRKLLDIFNKLRMHETCTLKDFQLVDLEHKSWLARYEDIVANEDVYANLDEMRNIWNYQNGNLIKILLKHVLPQLGKINDPAALQQLYYDKVYELAKLRFNKDGAPTRAE